MCIRDSGGLDGLVHFLGDAFAVLLLVVDDGQLLGLDLGGDIFAGGRALLVVGADGAEHHLVFLLGDGGVGGRRGNHENAFVLVQLRGGLGGAGTEMADHELDFLVDDLVGDRDRLFRFAGVIHDDPFEFLAVDAALGVDLLDRHLGAHHLHVAVLRDRPGGGASEGDFDGVLGPRQTAQAQNDGGDGGAQNVAACLLYTSRCV